MTLRKSIFTLFSLLCAVTLIAGLWTNTPAATAAPPPPRPTLTPTPYVAPARSAGSYIELRVPTNNINLWTVVQWQDPQGQWHDVETWRGILDEINNQKGVKLWWVSARDYGTGPFRWAIYNRPSGQLLAASRSFNLPASANQHEIVEVTLK